MKTIHFLWLHGGPVGCLATSWFKSPLGVFLGPRLAHRREMNFIVLFYVVDISRDRIRSISISSTVRSLLMGWCWKNSALMNGVFHLSLIVLCQLIKLWNLTKSYIWLKLEPGKRHNIYFMFWFVKSWNCKKGIFRNLTKPLASLTIVCVWSCRSH